MAPNGARPSVNTVLTEKLDSSEISRVINVVTQYYGTDDVIQMADEISRNLAAPGVIIIIMAQPTIIKHCKSLTVGIFLEQDFILLASDDIV